MLAIDGLRRPTPLTDAVLARYGQDPEQVVAWLDGARPRDYAVLAPLVVAHAASGDCLAEALMRQAADDLATIAERLLGSGPSRLSLLGGLAASVEPYMPDRIRAILSPPLGDALDGALLLAQRQTGRAP